MKTAKQILTAKIDYRQPKEKRLPQNKILKAMEEYANQFRKPIVRGRSEQLVAGFVYIVECSSGSWDSFHWYIGGIFNEAKDAEELKDKLNSEAKRIKDECPIKGNADDMSEEDEDKYWTYFSANENAMEWNDATVNKYPVNKPCR